MELTIQQSDLAFAVGRALGSVSTKSPLPLLSCVLLEAESGSLRVTGTDASLVRPDMLIHRRPTFIDAPLWIPPPRAVSLR